MSVQVDIHCTNLPPTPFKGGNICKYLLTVGFRAHHATYYRYPNIVNIWCSCLLSINWHWHLSSTRPKRPQHNILRYFFLRLSNRLSSHIKDTVICHRTEHRYFWQTDFVQNCKKNFFLTACKKSRHLDNANLTRHYICLSFLMMTESHWGLAVNFIKYLTFL